MNPHPKLHRTDKLIAPMAWIGASVALSAIVGLVAQLWDHKAPDVGAVFLASGPMFAVYITGCLVAGGVKRPRVLIPMFLYGALFPYWGVLVGMMLFFMGGTFGVPQALITALVLRMATKSWIPGIGALAGLAIGWGIQFTFVPDRILRWGVVIFPWHAAVVASLVVWVVTKTRAEARSHQGLCPTCGYDLAGLAPTAKCPECGRAEALPSGPNG